MKCTILGCGSSRGTPEIGCNCFTCSSEDPKNKRTRPSIMLEKDGTKILVDTGPDFRAQALNHGITSLDAVIYTHFHADHVAGIDDLKPLYNKDKPLQGYTNKSTYSDLLASYNYIFKQTSDIYPSLMQMNVIEDRSDFIIGNIAVQSFQQDHNLTTSLGLRFGDIAYSTDLCALSEEAFDLLTGVKIWIVDCLRYSWAPTHSHLERTLDWIARVKPELAILTHMSHDIEYNEIKAMLPANIVPAYDGLMVNL